MNNEHEYTISNVWTGWPKKVRISSTAQPAVNSSSKPSIILRFM